MKKLGYRTPDWFKQKTFKSSAPKAGRFIAKVFGSAARWLERK